MMGLIGAALAIGCEAPPAFPVPEGVRRVIVLDAESPIHPAAQWTIDAFVEALGIELAKYGIVLKQPKGHAIDPHVHVTLGSIAPRHWQSVDVYFDEETTPEGSVRVPDTALTTLEAAAEPVAVVIARRVWGVPESPAADGGGARP